MPASIKTAWNRSIQSPIRKLGLLALALAAVVILAALIALGYTQDWTGFKDFIEPTGVYHPAKTLWDWLELLVIPIALGLGVWWLNRSERRNELKIAEQRAQTERQIAADRLQEETLQAYLDRLLDLLVEEDLYQEPETSKASQVARIRTLTVLRRLDGKRKGLVLRFLHESLLIHALSEIGPPIILANADLSGADLHKADLTQADLSVIDLSHADLRDAVLSGTKLIEANLRGADLSGADLSGADMEGADLSDAWLEWADLSGANLSAANLSDASLAGANLIGANLSGANLSGAYLVGEYVTSEQLAEAKSLKGATMPDGTKHE